MSVIQKFFIATVLFTGLVLLAAPKAAADSTITPFVTDTNGRPQANVTVHLYAGGAGKCACNGAQCAIAPDNTGTTGRNGRTMFKGLTNDADYTVCIGDRCQAIRQCSNPANDCQFAGNCQTIHTPKHGGNTLVHIIQ